MPRVLSLLAVASDKLVPYLAIGAFAGLRQCEVARLDWSNVSIKERQIYVPVKAAKGGDAKRARCVPMSENLAAWLARHEKRNGPICPLANITNALHRAAKRARMANWVHNGLRHSFCSYRLAQVKNVAQVAFEPLDAGLRCRRPTSMRTIQRADMPPARDEPRQYGGSDEAGRPGERDMASKIHKEEELRKSRGKIREHPGRRGHRRSGCRERPLGPQAALRAGCAP